MNPGRRPAVDERLVDPEQNVEMIDGEVIPVSPAREPHGDRHSKLSALLEACVAEGFNVAVDMLTRTGWTSDVAPDASIYPRARDPETGGRQLEHLAFEVVGRQSLSHVARRARALSGRGVRRIFAADIEHERVLEWSPSDDGWVELPLETLVEDDALAVPLRLGELLTCVSSGDPVARMLLARRNAVIEDALEAREQRTVQRSILAFLRGRGLEPTEAQRYAIETTTDLDTLERWVTAAATCKCVDDLLDDRLP